MSDEVFLKPFLYLHGLCLGLRLLPCTSGKPGSAQLSFHIWKDFECGAVSHLTEARWKYGLLTKVRNSSWEHQLCNQGMRGRRELSVQCY